MKYIIMILIVVGLALSDFITGFIKGCITDRPRSAKMRKGGLNKLLEITVMVTVCGLEIGIEFLGAYYDAEKFSSIAGTLTAVGVFCYIVLMECVSILENYVACNPRAGWAKKIVKIFSDKLNDEEEQKHEDD